jgi:hypothetical protein
MARWAIQNKSFTPVAVADAAAFTDNGYLALQGGSGTQRSNILEVQMGGQAAASSPTIMELARDSTVAATAITAGTNGRGPVALDPASAALAAPPLAVGASTTKPQRSATLSLLELSFNAFGGIVRWVAAPGEEIGVLGNTASNGEVSLSAFTGGTPGLMSAHIVFEPF